MNRLTQQLEDEVFDRELTTPKQIIAAYRRGERQEKCLVKISKPMMILLLVENYIEEKKQYNFEFNSVQLSETFWRRYKIRLYHYELTKVLKKYYKVLDLSVTHRRHDAKGRLLWSINYSRRQRGKRRPSRIREEMQIILRKGRYNWLEQRVRNKPDYSDVYERAMQMAEQ